MEADALGEAEPRRLALYGEARALLEQANAIVDDPENHNAYQRVQAKAHPGMEFLLCARHTEDYPRGSGMARVREGWGTGTGRPIVFDELPRGPPPPQGEKRWVSM